MLAEAACLGNPDCSTWVIMPQFGRRCAGGLEVVRGQHTEGGVTAAGYLPCDEVTAVRLSAGSMGHQ